MIKRRPRGPWDLFYIRIKKEKKNVTEFNSPEVQYKSKLS